MGKITLTTWCLVAVSLLILQASNSFVSSLPNTLNLHRQRRDAINDRMALVKHTGALVSIQQFQVATQTETIDISTKTGTKVELEMRPNTKAIPVALMGMDSSEADVKLVTPTDIFTGSVKGKPGSTVVARVRQGKLEASVQYDNEEIFVAPLEDDEAEEGIENHAVFARSDVKVDTTKSCALVQHPEDILAAAAQRESDNSNDDSSSNNNNAESDDDDSDESESESDNESDGDANNTSDSDDALLLARRAACGGMCEVELAVDVDYDYYVSRGKNEGRVVSDIAGVIDYVNQQYERDLNVHFTITGILIRKVAGLYNSNSANTLLNTVRSAWRAGSPNLPSNFNPSHQLVTLFTGRNINQGTIGIAYMGAVCTSYQYSVVQSDFRGNGQLFPSASDLSAHELGHNFAADHCNCASPAYTMNPYITSANRFSPATIRNVAGYRDQLRCLKPYTGVPPATTTTAATTATTAASTTPVSTTSASTTASTTAEPNPLTNIYGCPLVCPEGQLCNQRKHRCDGKCKPVGEKCNRNKKCCSNKCEKNKSLPRSHPLFNKKFCVPNP